jgi:hypothetical protein
MTKTQEAARSKAVINRRATDVNKLPKTGDEEAVAETGRNGTLPPSSHSGPVRCRWPRASKAAACMCVPAGADGYASRPPPADQKKKNIFTWRSEATDSWVSHRIRRLEISLETRKLSD